MNSPTSSSRRIRSGLFEVDLSAGELHKNGRKLALQDQPFRVLAMLLEHPGDVVTREQLQARLWPADTYVGFDEGLNTAIRKLRLAFGDSADNPRFIETLPRRGYRFIAPVSEIAGRGEPRQAAIADMHSDGGNRDATGQTPTGDGGEALQAGDLTPSRGRLALPASRVRWSPLFVTLAGAVVLILACALYWMRPYQASTRRPSGPPKRVMLAILPFQNLSGDPSQDYFSDGVTEETITDLGQLSPVHLGVIARTSAMAYKHTDKTVGRIGSELGVDYILEGSVRRAGDRVRITAQLIRVSDQTHLWARSYDRELKDLIEVQNDIGKAIADQVQANLTPHREVEMSGTHTVDPEAYDLYLRGRFYWNQRTPGAIKTSIEYFQQAIGKYPNFALAYAGLADAYNISNIVGPYSPKDSFPQAKAAAEKAIELDPLLAEAHAALGMEKSHYEFDFPGAEEEFLKALELNPNSAYAHLFYGNCFLMPMGRMEEAIAEIQKAIALDPLSLPINNFMGLAYQMAGNYEKSYQQYQHTIMMDPSFPLAHSYFAGLLFFTGRFEEGIEEDLKGNLLGGADPEQAAAESAARLKALKSGGEKAFWRENLAHTLRMKKRDTEYFGASEIASAYALAGEKDKAFEMLEKAYRERDGQDITLLKCDPTFKNLRGDPRFSKYLLRLGLPE